MSIVVVGAGTAGISTISTLLNSGFSNIVWIDPYFEGGAMKDYDGIPSNTKAKNLSKFTRMLPLFSKYNEPQTMIDIFKRLDPEKQTVLNQLKQCLGRMTAIIKKDFGHRSKLIHAHMRKIIQRENSSFILQIDSNQHSLIQAKAVFLCLGGELKPVLLRPDLPRINIFDIMSNKKIQDCNFSNDIVEIHGSSHSAILSLRNLTLMKNRPKKIYHIMNKDRLLHAQYIEDWIRHDTSGLKGVASQFGKQYQKQSYKDYIHTQYTWDNVDNKDSTKLIEAIGFKPAPFEFVSKTGNSKYEIREGYLLSDSEIVSNLYLIGLLSPQFVVDRQGQRMSAVGVDNFVQYIQELISSKIKQLEF